MKYQTGGNPWAPPRPDPITKGPGQSWFVRRWRENPPLINFASVVLVALGLAQVAIGIILLGR